MAALMPTARTAGYCARCECLTSHSALYQGSTVAGLLEDGLPSYD